MIKCRSRGAVAALCAAVFAWPNVLAADLATSEISLVETNLANGATQSWELGTRSQALLELNARIFSVLTVNQALPPTSTIPSNLTSPMSTVLAIAKNVVANRGNSNGNVVGPQPLVNDSAAGDPASIGMVVLLANWTRQQDSDGLNYAQAATDQLDFLYSPYVPRTSDGAISHRTDQLQLWSDSVYMVPPFLAYYGVTTNNQTLLQEAYNQISLYRSYLRDQSAGNLWKHVLLGLTGNDEGHWATGNGWAAAGILRVLGTIANSPFANSMKSQQIDLANWVQEIHDGMYATLDSSEIFHNYPDQNLSATNFYDCSSTAIMASTVYRLSLMWGVHTYIPNAERSRMVLSSNSSNSGALEHFSSEGWLNPVVNPYNYPYEGTNSPEAQAFVLEMQAAWTDWVASGSPGASGSGAMRSTSLGWLSVTIVGAGLLLQWTF